MRRFLCSEYDRKDLNLRIRERGARFRWSLAQREVLSGAGRGEESADKGHEAAVSPFTVTADKGYEKPD